LSIIPTALLFFIALQFVSTSMDYWFNSNVEQALQESLDIAKNIYQEARERVSNRGEIIASRLALPRYRQAKTAGLKRLLENKLTPRTAGGPDSLLLLSDQRKPLVNVTGKRLDGLKVPEVPPELIRQVLTGKKNLITIQSIPIGDLVRGITPVTIGSAAGEINNILITSLLIPKKQLDHMAVISAGIEGYRQLMLLKAPIKTSLLVMLLIVTLLIIFCAVWFGFYVARGLTGPIGKLANALHRVADGELDFVLEKEADDEMGLLVDSFNQMTGDLLIGKQQLEKANLAMRRSNLELEKRRRYTEIILQNVPAGVISFDENGRITMINRFAEDLLQINKEAFLRRDYHTVLRPEHLAVLRGFLKELAASRKSSIKRPLRLTIGNETISLLVSFTKLEDEGHKPLGVVLVFDNLTQLEKAQRVAAWREVAKRIAHEVKNPLTPIQLSAQRLRKKYLAVLGKDGEVLDLCSRTIINQVDELKRLVGEFSNFARMPKVQMAINDMPAMVKDVLSLYEETHNNIEFRFNCPQVIPPFKFDHTQMRRVLINLLDNGIAVLPTGGIIEITISHDTDRKTIFMEVKDNGPGVKDQDKPRLFEPYFSTKKSGTGLGLAIASTIIADHGGYIRIRDNKPHGARFIVELPFAG